mmetsp:Transcript_57241/g.134771  ORF Transcript_57241/g.134771 Transcript_57241/m.134771 type:complete len:1162 (+) Transcript_57241:381-3866(+)
MKAAAAAGASSSRMNYSSHHSELDYGGEEEGKRDASRRRAQSCLGAARRSTFRASSRGQHVACGLAPLVAFAFLTLAHAITFPCVAPLLGPTIPSAPSREPSPARSRTPDDDPQSLRLTIRGGDLAVSKTPRARSESGVDSTSDEPAYDLSGKLRMSGTPGRPLSTGMKVMMRFRINYSTRWGENVMVIGSTKELGGLPYPSEAETRRAIAAGKGKVMRYIADGNWEFVTVMDSAPPEMSYRYALVREKGEPLVEGGVKTGRYLDLDDFVRKGVSRQRLHTVGSSGSSSSLSAAASLQGPLQLEVRDQWRVSRQHGEDLVLRSDALTRVIYGHSRAEVQEEALSLQRVTHVSELVRRVDPPEGMRRVPTTRLRLSVERTRVPLGCAMAVECEALFTEVAVMSCTQFPAWELEVDAPRDLLPAQYKYVVVNLTTGNIMDREDGALRWLSKAEGITASSDLDSARGHHVVAVRDEATTDRWPVENREAFRAAAVSVPLFSLRSKHGMGTGEFGDLCLLVDVCAAVGLSMIQLLPTADTTAHPHASWKDSSPYAAISVHALHPLYMRLSALPNLPPDIAAEINRTTEELNAGADNSTVVDAKTGAVLDRPLDYEKVVGTKLKLLRKIYEASGKTVVESSAFAEFLVEQGHWLKPYALFCVLRDTYGCSDFAQWGELGALSFGQIDALASPGGKKYSSCRYWYWVQFHLHSQLMAASRYAGDKGVALMGDLPIGVSRHGVEVWARPELFKLDKLTGAPPDAFTEMGQNWHFPAYDWDRMARDGFAWWRARLRSMSNYFHAMRIDHILGYFRLWELPFHAVTGLGGRFNPSHAISKEELDAKGLWDRQRLSRPYVRSHLLERRFGTGWEAVAKRFLELGQHGVYSFKPGLDTEAAVLDSMDRDPVAVEGMSRDKVLETLLMMLNDRCLLRDDRAPDDRFYPRVGLWQTDSYAQLGQDWQLKLKELHDSYLSWRQESLFEATARDRLKILQTSSNMLLVGEDLGMLSPACLPKVLADLAIPGLRIPRVTGGPPSAYPYLSVAASSSHDMATLAAWWEGLDGAKRLAVWKDMEGQGVPPEKCTPEVARQVVLKLLASPSLLTLIPIQDLLSCWPEYASKAPAGDQINTPGIQHYWRWRCSASLEEMAANQPFKDMIRGLVEGAGRLVR